jgi:hypothetical protein
MPFQFPDPSVSTTATLPNGEKWEYVDGAWRAVRLTDNDQAQIDTLIVDDQEQAAEIEALQQGQAVDRQLLINVSQRISEAEINLAGIQGLDLTNALSALALAQQDIIELKSKVDTLELTSFLILE